MAIQPNQIENQIILDILKEHEKPLRKCPYIIGFIFIVGIILSFYNNEWSWVSRSGSLIVIYGLLIARWDFTNKIHEGDLNSLDPSIIRNCKKFDLIIDAQTKEIIKKGLRIRIHQYTKPKFRSMELITIIIGTFIWGFGGLIGVIINWILNWLV